MDNGIENGVLNEHADTRYFHRIYGLFYGYFCS